MNLPRKPALFTIALGAVLLLAAACSSSTEMNDAKRQNETGTVDPNAASTGQPTKTGLPCDVAEVLTKNCQTCHASSPKSGASTSLVTWDDLQKEHGGKKLYELVKERIHAETGRMPPAARLTDVQIKSIDDWIAGGAKQTNDSCEVAAPPPATRPFECPAPGKVSVLKASKPFTWTDETKADEYVCFGVDVTVTAKRHVIAMGPMVENLGIVHHTSLYQAKESVPPEGITCTAAGTGKWKLVSEWAPGGGNMVLPPEAGYPEEGTTHWVVQVHYNNATGTHKGESDNSGYQLCSTDQLRPNDAGMLAFGSTLFTIPPRTAKYGITCDYKLGSKYKGLKLFNVTPHMHTRGMGVSTERIPGGTGSPELVFQQIPFNFENQENFKIATSVEPGDIMRTHCLWKNPTDEKITWGEDTADEMCFNFVTYYPAIPDETLGPVPTQTWITPSVPTPITGVDCVEDK